MAKGLIDEMIIAEGENADWTLLAQRGEHYHLSQGMLLGTTAEGVARKSTKPVLIAPRVFHEIESMGLAYDGSGPAQRALILAGSFEKTKWPLTVITITDDPGVAESSSRKKSTLEAFDIDFEGITLKGREDREILNFIRQGAVELMIMGAFGHRRIRELLLGSTTSHIIRNSTIPVSPHALARRTSTRVNHQSLDFHAIYLSRPQSEHFEQCRLVDVPGRLIPLNSRIQSLPSPSARHAVSGRNGWE